MKKWVIGAMLAATAATPALAQDGGWHGRRGGSDNNGQSGQQQPRPERSHVEAQPQAQAQPRPEAQPQQNWRGGGDNGGWHNRGGEVQAQPQVQAQAQAERGWQNRGGWQGRRDLPQQQPSFQQPQGGQQYRPQEQYRQRPDQFRGGQFTPADNRRAPESWRHGKGPNEGFDNRGGDPRANVYRGNGDRAFGNRGYDNGARYENRFDGRGGNWNRDWRHDNRYDWNRFRVENRSAFRLPRYYSPYGWDYGYRRFSIGVTLSSVLWGQDYWIDDPYDYRLPPAYGPYRWVRYYNDALLVDLRSGLVVDTVYDIFW